MQNISLVYDQVTNAARELRAAGLDVNETNINCWLSMPAAEREFYLPRKEPWCSKPTS